MKFIFRIKSKKILLEKSNIDPTDSYKAVRGDFSRFIRFQKRSYTITSIGKIKAREVLKKPTESLL